MVKKITIAIDAMGGENAPEKTIEGVKLFLKNNQTHDDFIINLFGDKKKIEEKLKKENIDRTNLKITHTQSVVADNETPLTAIKNSKNTSMWIEESYVGFNISKTAQIDGWVAYKWGELDGSYYYFLKIFLFKL